ncbi:MAG TPA: flagellar filament capping protein FliD [Longimicrobiaceae bacterium]
MDPIASFGGLASGIQWKDMIDEIMKLESARAVTPLSNRLSTQQARIEAWKTYEGLVSKLKSASLALRDGTSFGIYQATAGTTASGRAVISATASSGASPGSYQVEVKQLARAAKLSSTVEGSATTALGLSGQFFVNGRAVEVTATDTLNDIRDRINSVNSGSDASGVTATILTTGPNEHRLILTADQTGSRGIELVDSASSGGVLQQLGVLDATYTANVSPSDASRTETHRFNDSTRTLAAMLGVSPSPPETTIEIDGRKITVDLATDTLITVMNKVAAAGGSANLVEEIIGGRTHYRLSVEGTVSADPDASDPAASQRIVELLGFQQAGRVGEIAAGTDAEATIDGFTLTSRSNVLSGAIAGVSINLLAAEPGEAVELTIARDTDATVDAIQGYVDAFNAVRDFVTKQQTGGDVLATNGTLRTTARSLTEVMLSDVSALAGSELTRAANAGVALDRDGKLTLDTARLKEVLESNPNDVRTLFQEVGREMYEASDAIAASFTGTVASQIRFLEESNSALELRIEDAEQRLELRRQSLIRQYTQMETMLSRIQSQGNWLTQQFQSMQPSGQ